MQNAKERAYIYKVELNNNMTNDARIIASEYLDFNTTVLDVGCACGDFGSLISNEKQCDVYGMDYDTDSLLEAEKKQVFKELNQIDLNSFNRSEYNEYLNKFDYITLIDVLEHTIDPKQSLQELKPFLKNNGNIVVSLPNISFGDIKIGLLDDDFTYTEMGILDKTHLRFFTYKTIASFFAECGFQILTCRAKVSNITFNKSMPTSIRNFIKKNPHSYVYQYVFDAKQASEPYETLFYKNISVMNLQWDAIRDEIKKIQKKEFITLLLPVGSKRREIIKNIYKSLCKGKDK